MTLTLHDDFERMLKRSIERGAIALGRTLREDEVALLERAVLRHLFQYGRSDRATLQGTGG